MADCLLLPILLCTILFLFCNWRTRLLHLTFLLQLEMRLLTVFMGTLGTSFGLLGVYFTPPEGIVTCAESPSGRGSGEYYYTNIGTVI